MTSVAVAASRKGMATSTTTRRSERRGGRRSTTSTTITTTTMAEGGASPYTWAHTHLQTTSNSWLGGSTFFTFLQASRLASYVLKQSPSLT